MLRVDLVGHLGGDAAVRQSQKGALITSFRVAVNQVRIGQDGDRQESTDWFSVQVVGREADFARRLGKGARVFVAGRLDIRHYQTRDGEPRTGYDVWADEVQSLSPLPPVESAAPTSPEQPAVETVDEFPF
jgi:single-strand DNA-binding protein